MSKLFQRVEISSFWIVALGCLVSLVSAAWAVRLPYQLNFAEGPLLGEAVRIAQGLSAYPTPTDAPYVMNPYGPVPYYLFALIVKFFGVGFIGPRLFVVVSGICCASLITLLLRHWQTSLPVGLTFGALFLAMPAVQQWLYVMRVDLIALAFSLLGLYLFVSSTRPYLSALFFIFAMFCKFSYLSAPTACLIYILSRRDGKKALKFAGACAALAGLAFLFCQREFGGWFAFHTIWTQTTHPYNLLTAATKVRKELRDNIFLILMTCTVIYLSDRQPARREASLPLIYVSLTFLTMLTCGKLGGDSNYFLEWEAALCLCAGLGYSYFRTETQRLGAAGPIVPGLLALAVLASVLLTVVHRNPMQFASLSGCNDAYEYVRNYPGEQILSENVGAMVLAGKLPLVFEPFLWTREVVGAGWSDSKILNMVRSRQIDLILLSDDAESLAYDTRTYRWPHPLAQAIEHNYVPAKTFVCTDAHFAYKPGTP